MLTLASVYIIMNDMVIEKRHKCHCCGAVRYENRMRKLQPKETTARSQFGNDEKCWVCRGECWRPENCSYAGYGKMRTRVCEQIDM